MKIGSERNWANKENSSAHACMLQINIYRPNLKEKEQQQQKKAAAAANDNE